LPRDPDRLKPHHSTGGSGALRFTKPPARKNQLVNLRYADDRLEVVVQDVDIGASERLLRGEVEVHRFGLRNMRRQVAALGGTFEAENGEDSGVVIQISIPLTASSTL
jgi:signal transduction histidine kinase